MIFLIFSAPLTELREMLMRSS